MTNPLQGSDKETHERFTIWAMHCPFRKSGSPVVGTMGSTIRSVIVIEGETWKRLCAAHPSLATQEFNVGTFDD